MSKFSITSLFLISICFCYDVMAQDVAKNITTENVISENIVTESILSESMNPDVSYPIIHEESAEKRMPHSYGDQGNWDFQARESYYYPTSSKVRKIYPNISEFQLELSYQPCGNIWGGWIEGGYVSKKGKSIGSDNHTQLKLYPLSAGIKYLFVSCKWTVYIGAGLAYSFLRIKNDSPYVPKFSKANRVGGVGKIGFDYHIGFLTLGGFIDYYYTNFHFSGHKHNIKENDVNMSAFLFGGAIGVNF